MNRNGFALKAQVGDSNGIKDYSCFAKEMCNAHFSTYTGCLSVTKAANSSSGPSIDFSIVSATNHNILCEIWRDKVMISFPILGAAVPLLSGSSCGPDDVFRTFLSQPFGSHGSPVPFKVPQLERPHTIFFKSNRSDVHRLTQLLTNF